MRRIDRRIIMVVALVFIVGLAYGLMKFLIAQKEEPMMRPNIEAYRFVKAELVRYDSVISPVSETGRMSSVAEVDIIAEASGKIIQADIPLKKGAAFRKGQKLFSVYSDEFELALQAKRSKFLNTLANFLPDIKVDFQEHEKTFMDFFRSIDLEKDLPDFPLIEDDQLKVFLASRNVQSDYLGIRKDELQLKRYSVYAQFDGTLIDVYLEAGSYTNMGGRVAHAVRTDRLEMEVHLKRMDAEWVNIGDPVKVTAEASGEVWQGKVIRKAQMVEENTQRRGVYVQLIPQKGKQILVGEYLFAEFPGKLIKDVMEIPRNVVFNTNEVFILVDGRLVKKEINIVKTNENTLVFNGLEEGSKMVVQPLINVLEGTPVKVLGEDQPNAGQKGRKAEGQNGGQEVKSAERQEAGQKGEKENE